MSGRDAPDRADHVRRLWLHDDHARAWLLYEIPDDALPGLEAMEGRQVGMIHDDLITDPPRLRSVLALHFPDAPPLPDAAWPAGRPDTDALDGDPDGRFDRCAARYRERPEQEEPHGG